MRYRECPYLDTFRIRLISLTSIKKNNLRQLHDSVNNNVNNTELFDAEPRLLVIDSKPRLLFSEKNEPELSRDSNKTCLN